MDKGPPLNLYIDPLNGLIVAVSCIVGYLVYRPSTSGTNLQSSQPHGDRVGGVTAASASIVILAFLFGLADGQASEAGDGSTHQTPSVQETRDDVADPTTPSEQPAGKPPVGP